MRVVILGGNECMVCQYKSLCKKYQCKAKVFAKMNGTLRGKIGNPDLLVMFTGTMSHKMVQCALAETKGQNTRIVHCKSASMSALEDVLSAHNPMQTI